MISIIFLQKRGKNRVFQDPSVDFWDVLFFINLQVNKFCYFSVVFPHSFRRMFASFAVSYFLMESAPVACWTDEQVHFIGRC